MKRIAIRKDGTIPLDEFKKFADKFEKENKKLKEKIDYLEEEVEMWKINRTREREELKKKIQTLELWLDNKEKLNEEYRKQIDKYKHYYDRDKEELMESCYALAKENENLKEDLSKARQDKDFYFNKLISLLK